MIAVKWIAGAGLAAAFTIGAIFVPGAGAQGVSADTAAIDGGIFNQGRASVMQMVRNGDGPAFVRENGFGGIGRKAPGGKHQMMNVVAEQLGMTPEELRAELQASLEGGTPVSIADVAVERGVALETIENAIIEQMSEKLAEKVANGDLTQEEADERLAQASERVSTRLTQPFDGNGPHGRAGRRGGAFAQGMSVITEQLGMTRDELRAELQAGKSIADVAAEQGVALETIEDAIIDQMSEKLAEKVANGDLTQEEADQRLEEARQRIQERLSQPGGQRGEGRPGGPRGQGGRQGPAFNSNDA